MATPAVVPPKLVDVTDADGRVPAVAWLAPAERLHRVLRPQLPADYVATMQRVFAGGGRMAVAVDGPDVTGLAVWRVVENTMFGRFLYVDDLVTDELRRSRGVGRALLAHCEACAVEAACTRVVLDSGVQRERAHRFYFREGYGIQAFNFGKPITSAPE